MMREVCNVSSQPFPAKYNMIDFVTMLNHMNQVNERSLPLQRLRYDMADDKDKVPDSA
jgi:hypothetical protein